MDTLKSFVNGRWVEGDGAPTPLLNPSTEEVLAETSTAGLDMSDVLRFARQQGRASLQSMTFAERGAMLRKLSRAVVDARTSLLEVSMLNNGATRSDAKFDVDGASFTLAAYAELGEELGDRRWVVDGDAIELLRMPRLAGMHIKVPKPGVALHVNAYNFPAWGLAEKAAVALLAGMPVVTKPATATAITAHDLAKVIVDADVLPQGAFSFIAGPAGDVVDHLQMGDVLAFTGSSAVGQSMKSLPHVVEASVSVNVEADSVNAAVLGPDVDSSSEAWDLFVRDVVKDMTQKTGQKCTAIRRIIVPVDQVGAVSEALIEEIRRLKIGNPMADGVRMGPLVSAQQCNSVMTAIGQFSESMEKLYGCGRPEHLEGVEDGRGFFVDPHLFRVADPAASLAADLAHRIEIFGPVGTILPYDGTAAGASALVALGRGSLVTSVYSDDRRWLQEVTLESAPYNGRIVLGNTKVASISPGPGTVLPQLVHGGPGRAGGGEELGGIRGMDLYFQRTAIEGYRPLVERLFG